MDAELLQGSILLVWLWLMLGSLGIPLPEDVALLSAGVLIHRGGVAAPLALIVCYVGVIGGDITLFFLGRRYGMRLPLVKRLLPPRRRERIENAYRRYGGRLVFAVRYFGGFRAAMYVMAGMYRMPPRRFILFDGVAALLSVPLMVGIGYFGSMHIERVLEGAATVRHYVVLVGIVAVLGLLVWRHLCRARD